MFRYIYGLISISLLSLSLNSSATTIAQDPLYLVVSANPNVLFNMSIESPMGSAAYNDQPGTLAGGSICGGRNSNYGVCYFNSETYLGYFDPLKCYSYTGSGASGYFEPDGATNSLHECSGKFSGNMLNWASMTAMDAFVYTMTGGNRITDDTGSNAHTIVKRARKAGSNSWYPWKWISDSLNTEPKNVSPWDVTDLQIYNLYDGQSYSSHTASTEEIVFVSGSTYSYYNLHVRLCDKAEGLEENCTSYNGGDYYKPEGLVQNKADHMRFAVTSYLKDDSKDRDGGVLRANMKYVGLNMPDGSGGTTANSNAEINADGTFIDDPDGLTGEAGVDYSGVINYINKFSEYGYKSADPASELFYESIRYFKNLGPTPEYSSDLTDDMKGGFPVIRFASDWNDPIEYSCQKNFIIGINDANPWLDKSLPGTFFTSSTVYGYTPFNSDYGEPSNPDSDIDVKALTNTVGDLEGLNGTDQCIGCTAGDCNLSWGVTDTTARTVSKLGEVMGTCPAPYKENSYYIAGLAYYANTQDIRDDLDDEQNISTFMIDTQEYSENPLTGQMNMLWLAGKYGGFVDSNNNDEPDLDSEWDTDNDGEPDNYVLATRPDLMVASLNSSFDEIEQQTSSASAIATNSTRLDTDSKIYQARFSSSTWTGDLLAYNLKNSTGAVDSLSWSAADLVPSENNRKIYSSTGSVASGVVFEYANLDAAQQASITSDEVDYIRGDQSNEGVVYRTRPHVLGDIINSDPIYTGRESFNYYSLEMSGVDSTYYAYLKGITETWQKGVREEVLYVGANDGMLHAFRGEGTTTSPCNPDSQDCEGEELFAYIPKSLISSLTELTQISYDHRYYVDGTARHGDAYINFDGTGDRWGTALIGVLGAGGKGVFALDVSDPLNFDSTDVLWDLDDSDLADLGYTFSQPSVVKLANGDWGAVFGNGYNSANHEAVLYIVNLETGSVIKEIHTGVFGDSSNTNGLSTPIVIDSNDDKVADTVYAGDLKGNMWAFDISAGNTNSWDVAYSQGSTSKPLFTACTDDPCTDPQPITSKPQVIKADDGSLIILFGTGKFFEVGDNTDTSQVQSYYGIQDDGAVVAGRGDLVGQTIIGEFSAADTGLDYNTRVTSDTGVDLSIKDGWYIDFDSSSYPGERVIANSLVRSGRIIFPTLVPETDACSYGGTSWLMELDAQTGSRLTISPYDLNGDGVIDTNDMVGIDTNNDNQIDTYVVASGKESTVGIIKTPGVISTGDDEKKYTSGSSGNIEVTTESSGDILGRQSWRQLK